MSEGVGNSSTVALTNVAVSMTSTLTVEAIGTCIARNMKGYFVDKRRR